MSDDKRPDEHSGDDRLADLFGRLPDPRRRAVDDSAAPAVEKPASPPLPSSSAEDAAARQVPLSRRELRQRATGESPTIVPPSRRESDAPAPVTAPSTSGAPAAPDPVSATPQPTTEPAPEPRATPRAPSAAEPIPGGVAAGAAAGSQPQRRRSATPTLEDVSPEGRATSTPTLDELFAEEKRIVPSKKEKRRNRRIGGWIALGVVVLLFGGIGLGVAWAWSNYEGPIRALMGWEEPRDYEDGIAEGEALVTISSGDGGQAISQSLFNAGVTKTPGAFYSWLLELDAVPTFYPGVYTLQQKMTSAAALAALENPENKLENSALVREGLTVEQTLPILAEGIGLPIEDFQAAIADPAAYGVAASSLEGWLFPALYEFDPGITATQVIQRMVDRTVTSLDTAGVPVDDRQRILTIASIIQREARETDDFYKVSRVIQNRLLPDNPETFGKLQMDSTAQYGYGEMHDGTVSSSAEALEDDNPWNTYVVEGLPVGPIANPGDVAIDAAMKPVEGTWLYFVTVNLDTGETVFTDTYDEHLQAVDQWQQWCADNPDGGC
ncbi:MAG: endolytic transglycosylase MltG [Microbacterium sp.]|uniref:endolytic transglycosylase MltG n=1 Tax=Microbacterium sp. TaxID=51671 RepID=UPI00271E6A7A|nr:endolytic transglycosylase MltG [Microbacterium sp.]MDO8382359.1 endolytic transglycosylase MltG [Microbacterium sp.]